MHDLLDSLVPTMYERGCMYVGGFSGWAWSVCFESSSAHTAAMWLLCFMGVDYITGMYRAIRTTGLSSKTGFQGLVKKSFILLICAISHGIDVITGFSFVQTTIMSAFALNEFLSILENIGRVHPTLFPSEIAQFLKDLKRRGIQPSTPPPPSTIK